MTHVYVYRAVVVRVKDADTVVLNLDLGFGVGLLKQTFRFHGINAPEKNTPEGKDAIACMAAMLPADLPVTVQTFLDRSNSDRKEKYGRWLARVFVGDLCVNDELVRLGKAEIYTV